MKTKHQDTSGMKYIDKPFAHFKADYGTTWAVVTGDRPLLIMNNQVSGLCI